MLESRNTTPLKKPSQNEDFPNSHLKKYKVTLPSKTERNKVLSSQYLADNVKDGDVYSYTENNCDILLIDFNGQQKWQSNVENVVFGQRNGFLGKMHGSMESTIQQNECEIINLKDWQNKNESLVIETRKIVQDIKNQSNGQHDHELISLVPSTNPQARTLISSLAPVQNDPHQQQDSALTSSLLLLPNEPQRQHDPVSISPPVFVPNIRQLQQDPFVFVFKRQHELNEKFINIKDDISYPTEEENEDFEFEHHPKTLTSYEIWIQGLITRYERDQSISDKDFEMFEYYEKKLFGRGTQVQAANRKKRSRPFSDAADYRLKNIHLTIPEENKQNMPDPILVRLGHMFHGVKSMLTRK